MGTPRCTSATMAVLSEGNSGDPEGATTLTSVPSSHHAGVRVAGEPRVQCSTEGAHVTRQRKWLHARILQAL